MLVESVISACLDQKESNERLCDNWVSKHRCSPNRAKNDDNEMRDARCENVTESKHKTNIESRLSNIRNPRLIGVRRLHHC